MGARTPDPRPMLSPNKDREWKRTMDPQYHSQPPCSYSTTEYNTPIPALSELLSKPGEHILLGDLNLHHPWWCGPRNPATHKAADQLIDTLQTHDMQLALPNGLVT